MTQHHKGFGTWQSKLTYSILIVKPSKKTSKGLWKNMKSPVLKFSVVIWMPCLYWRVMFSDIGRYGPIRRYGLHHSSGRRTPIWVPLLILWYGFHYSYSDMGYTTHTLIWVTLLSSAVMSRPMLQYENTNQLKCQSMCRQLLISIPFIARQIKEVGKLFWKYCLWDLQLLIESNWCQFNGTNVGGLAQKDKKLNTQLWLERILGFIH